MLGRTRTYEGSSLEVDFEQSPFDTNPHSKVYYDLPKWREHLTFLQKFCSGYKPLSLVVGGVGAGKSTLLSQFISELHDDIQFHVIKADCSYDNGLFISEIYHGFNLLSGENTIESLTNTLRQQTDKKSHKLLVVDDAHQLPNETLEALLNIALKQLVGLQLRIMLFGENFLKKRIEVIREKSNAPLDINVISLNPFTLEETKNYIHFRMQTVGGLSPKLFSDFMLHRIHELSAGYPSRINRVAQQMLVDKTKFFGINKAANQKEKKSRSKLPFIVSFLLLVLAGVVISFIYLHNKPIPKKVIAKKPVVQKVVYQQPKPIPKELADAYIAPIAGLPEEKPELIQQTTAEAVNQGMSSEMAIADEAFLRKEAVVSEHSVVTPKKPESSPPTPIANKGYTLQLMGVHIPHNLEKYVSMHGLNSKTHLYHTNLNGQDWYVLTFGQYNTMKEAQEAIKDLPPELKEQQPWPRSLASLH